MWRKILFCILRAIYEPWIIWYWSNFVQNFSTYTRVNTVTHFSSKVKFCTPLMILFASPLMSFPNIELQLSSTSSYSKNNGKPTKNLFKLCVSVTMMTKHIYMNICFRSCRPGMSNWRLAGSMGPDWLCLAARSDIIRNWNPFESTEFFTDLGKLDLPMVVLF